MSFPPGIVSLLLLSFLGCGGGGGDSGGSPALQVSTPPSGRIAAATITLRIGPDALTAAAVERADGTRVTAVKSTQGWFAFEVPLEPGKNTLSVRGTLAGAPVATSIELECTAFNNALSLRPAPTITESVPFHVTGTIAVDAALGPVASLLIDVDGDGVIERVEPTSASVALSYDRTGRFVPRITARLVDGSYVSSVRAATNPITVLPSTTVDSTWPDVGDGAITDLAHDLARDRLVALSRDVAIVDSVGRVSGRLTALGAVEPAAVTVDSNGDLLVVDRGGHRVLRALVASDYALDPTLPNGAFGRQGSGTGELQRPLDVAAITDSSGQPRYHVLDAGNRRVVSFGHDGTFVGAFDGTGTPHGVLDTATRIAAVGVGAVAVLERGVQIRVFGTGGAEFAIRAADPEVVGEGARIVALEPGDGDTVWAVERGARGQRAFAMRADGNLVRTVVTLPADLAALAIRTRALGRSIAVANASSSAIGLATLAQDPIGQDPVAAVMRYLDALTAGDRAAAKAALRDVGPFDAAWDDPARRAALREFAAACDALVVEEYAANTALVAGVHHGTEDRRVVFPLLREPDTGTWMIAAY